MMWNINKKKNIAQSILEYTVLLTVVAAALVAMKIYFQRGIQSVVKVAADEIGSQRYGASSHYEDLEWIIPDHSHITTETQKGTTTNVLGEGEAVYVANETINRSGSPSHFLFREKE